MSPPAVRTRWPLVIAAGLAMFMAQLDTLVVDVALPSIAADLHTRPSFAGWIVLAYLLPMIALTLPSGRWLDQVGTRAALTFAVTGFALASAAAGMFISANGAMAMSATAPQLRTTTGATTNLARQRGIAVGPAARITPRTTISPRPARPDAGPDVHQHPTMEETMTPTTPAAARLDVVPAGRYRLDPARSKLTFHTRHIFGLAAVTGTMQVVSGEVVVEAADVPQGP